MAEPQKVQVVYRRAEDYRVVAASTFGGGLSGQGQLLLQAILEYAGPPDVTVHAVTPEQGIGPELSRDPVDRRLYRELQVGIVMTPAAATHLLRWLQENLPKVIAAAAKVQAQAPAGPGKPQE
jgi:hypothetical protein